MTRSQKIFVILLRIAVGWFLLYQGVNAILDPSWSLVSAIKPAHMFPDFYTWVLSPSVLPYITYLVKGMFIISGLLLVLGIFVRIGALIGILVMLFFYFPLVTFPYVGKYYIIDDHLLLAIVLAYLFAIRAGEFFGLGTFFKFSRY